MDIKVKGTSTVGIIAYDLSDPHAKEEMLKAQNMPKLSVALWEFQMKLRAIRKYEDVPQLANIEMTDALKRQIIDTEEYYSALYFSCLEEYEALGLVD
jgi:hypothetical protein